MGNKLRKEGNSERLLEYSYGNQLKVDSGVHRTRSLMDRAPLWLRGRCGFKTFSQVKFPPRLHLSSAKKSGNQIEINKDKIKIKEKQARSLDKTRNWLRGNLYFNNYNVNNYINFSVKK